MLTLKPTNLPSKPADDYEVFDKNRRAIGRIMRTAGMPAASPQWFWSFFRGHGPQAASDKGYAITREEAMTAFKSAWAKSAWARPEMKEAAN